jgi:hypothetical protein
MGAGVSGQRLSSSSFDERPRSRSCSDSRREQSSFPIEKLRLILFSEEGLKLLLQFISKCSKDGKTINFLTTLSSLSSSNSISHGNHGGGGRGRNGGWVGRSDDENESGTSYETILNNFISQYLNEDFESSLYLMKNMNRLSFTPSSSSTSSFSFSPIANSSHNRGSHSSIISSFESQLPQLIVMLAIGAFPEFLHSEEYEHWCQYEQLLITTTEFHNSIIFDSSSSHSSSSSSPLHREVGGAYYYFSRIHCADFSSLVNQPQWILALAKCFDHLPFPICIHSAKPPHLFLYANECFLTSSGYTREELFLSSIDLLLMNPFDSIEQYPNLSYQQQYQHFQEYESLLNELKSSIQNGLPCRKILKLSTKSLRTVYNLMTLVPLTNLLGEYIYMISIHCNYQTINPILPGNDLYISNSSSSNPRRNVSGRVHGAGAGAGYVPHNSSHPHHSTESKRHEYKQSSSSTSSRDSTEDYHAPLMAPPPSSSPSSSTSPSQEALQDQAAKHILLLDHFIHCLPYRIHHTKSDSYFLVNTYLDESKLQQQERNESKISRRTTEDLIV